MWLSKHHAGVIALLAPADLLNPAPTYRPVPFWFWNADLRVDELVGQLRRMHAMGCGGAFIHARFGLEDDYMGEAWFAAIRACCEAARPLRFALWLYDENPFPSGIGALKVTAVPEFCAKFLQLVHHPHACRHDADTLAAVSDGCGGTWEVRRHVLTDPGGKVFGPDYLSSQAMRFFFQTTHDVYAEHLSEYFGNVIPGIFTDEPTLLPWHHDLSWYGLLQNRHVVPWGDALPEYLARRGVGPAQLEEGLFALFDADVGVAAEGKGDGTAFRRAYWAAVAELYEDSFAKPYRAWCDAHGLLLTGHLLLEEGLYTNTLFEANPAAILQHFHIPGTDHLGADAEYAYGGFSGLPQTLTNIQGEKLVASVAHTRGAKRVLSETFGCAGWGLDLAAAKRVLDWQLSLGVNMLCPHAFFQSIEGYRKTDAPPSFLHNASSRDFRLFADYAGRACALLSQGLPAARIGVVYALEGFQGLYRSGCAAGPEAPVSRSFDLACSALPRLQHDYDILDTAALSGALVEAGQLLVGDGRYDTVIVPYTPFLPVDAATVLAAFSAAGGTVLEMPAAISAVSAADTANSDPLGSVRAWLEDALAGTQPLIALSPEGPGVRCIARRCPSTGELAYFVANVSGGPYVGTAAFAGATSDHALWQYDLETGAATCLATGSAGPLALRLPGFATQAFVLRRDGGVGPQVSDGRAQADGANAGGTAPAPPAGRTRGGVLPLGPEWHIRPLDPNVLPLGEWRFSMVSGNCAESFNYDAEVTADYVPDDLQLLLDDVEYREAFMGGMQLTLTVNGEAVVSDVDTRALAAWATDPRLKLVPVARHFRVGVNTLRLTIGHSCWSGQPRTLTSAPKLLGAFGLSRGRLVPPTDVAVPAVGGQASWEALGYTFLSGTIAYDCTFDSASVPADRPEATIRVEGDVANSMRVLLGGEPVGTRAWGPWEVTFGSSALRPGLNQVTIEVTNTSQNTLEGIARESGLLGRVSIRW